MWKDPPNLIFKFMPVFSLSLSLVLSIIFIHDISVVVNMDPLQYKWIFSTERYNANSSCIYIHKLLIIFDMGIITE